MEELKSRKFYGKHAAKLHELLESSVCEVVYRDDLALIRFRGPAAVIPSTSNSKQIRFVGSKFGGGNRRPIITNSDDNLVRLQAMMELFISATSRAKIRFMGKVFVFVLLGKRRVAYDSHNFSKTVGDWLEAVEVIPNDRNAEIHCFKKADYPELSSGEGWAETTDIFLTQRPEVRRNFTEILGGVVNGIRKNDIANG